MHPGRDASQSGTHDDHDTGCHRSATMPFYSRNSPEIVMKKLAKPVAFADDGMVLTRRTETRPTVRQK